MSCPLHIPVSDDIHLEALRSEHAALLYALTVENMDYLAQWLPWPRSVRSLADTAAFIAAARDGFERATRADYGIFFRQQLCGVMGFNELDTQGQTATIGYWLARTFQGRGIARAALAQLIGEYRREMEIRRFTILCAVSNVRSNRLAVALQFRLAALRVRAELLNGIAHDHNVYVKDYS